MARVLLAWELGGGTGHLVNFSLPLGRLSAQGHEVFLALRDLSCASAMFKDATVSYLQAPYQSGRPRVMFEAARTFAHILFNIGFGDVAVLETLVDAWRNLIDMVRPDLIIFDHSPTALLAARGSKARRVILGNSFSSPPDYCPLPDLQPWLPHDPELFQVEPEVLNNANHVLRRRGQPTLERLGQLYGEVDEVLLTTLPEFDHYPMRTNARYRGPWLPTGGESPDWPAGPGKRLFAYLKPFPSLPQLLNLLAQANCRSIIHIENCPPDAQNRFGAPNLLIETRRLNLRRVIQESDLAILNGTHGSTLLTLLAGKPILQFPIVLEQELNSRATVRLGVGAMGSMHPSQALEGELQSFLQSEAYAESARQFAARYANHSPDQQCEQAVERLAEMLT
jgi:hypothetical protein